MPVHVNAYFELSSNRRDIWRADDTVGDSKTRGLWNESLMKEVVAPLYALLIMKSRSMIVDRQDWGAADGIYQSKLLQLLPCPAPTDSWGLISSALFPLLKSKEVHKELFDGFVVVTLHAYRLYGVSIEARFLNSKTFY